MRHNNALYHTRSDTANALRNGVSWNGIGGSYPGAGL